MSGRSLSVQPLLSQKRIQAVICQCSSFPEKKWHLPWFYGCRISLFHFAWLSRKVWSILKFITFSLENNKSSRKDLCPVSPTFFYYMYLSLFMTFCLSVKEVINFKSDEVINLEIIRWAFSFWSFQARKRFRCMLSTTKCIHVANLNATIKLNFMHLVPKTFLQNFIKYKCTCMYLERNWNLLKSDIPLASS